jgi:hypothetical protein
MDRMQRQYKDAVEWLDENYPFFTTYVLGLGKPKWDASIPTAAVGLLDPEDKSSESFEFLFNPEFFASMDDKETAFVMAHETLHIFLNHLKLARNFVNYDKYFGLTKKSEKEKLTKDEQIWMFEEQKNMKRFNIAADCVINDYLNNQGVTPLDFAMRGSQIVGYDCAYRTVSEVYDDLRDIEPDSVYVELDNHNWMVMPGSGEMTEEEMEKARGQAQDILDQIYEDAKAQGLPADMDSKREDLGAASGLKDGGWMAGKGVGEEMKFVEQYGVTFAWAKLLREVDPDFFPEKGISPPFVPSYHKPRRKLAAFYPDVILPVSREETRRKDKSQKVPAMVMALDTSGSIPDQMKKTFVTLAKSIPQDRIKLFACTFQTSYVPLDLDNPQYYGGGTDFSAVEQFIRDKVEPELGHYPKAVVVITDGQAQFSTARPGSENEDRWVWILSRGWNPPAIGRKERLEDYTVRA